MAPAIRKLSHLVNPLATPEQLAWSASQVGGISADLERSLIFAGGRLAQIAGTLLLLPQDIISQAIVIFTRFWVGQGGGSLREYNVKVCSTSHSLSGTVLVDRMLGCFCGLCLSCCKVLRSAEVAKEHHQHLWTH